MKARFAPTLSFALVTLASLVLAPGAARADGAAHCAAAALTGQELRDGAKYKAARASFVACGGEECPAVVRRDCLGWLTEVNQLSPTLVLRARDARNADLGEVNVTVDGEVVSERLDGKPIFVDPGPHVIRGTVVNAPPIEQKIIVQAGEKNRLIELRFAIGEPEAAAPAPPAETQTTRSGALPLIVGGAGVAALGVATFFLATGLSDRSDLKHDPCAKTETCSQKDVDGVNTKLLAADIAAGAGVVAIGVAAYLFLTASPKRDHSARALPFDVRATAGGGTVMAGGRF